MDAEPSAQNPPAKIALPQLWGGVECTVNRVGDCFHDQIERSGHRARLDDLDRFADLGITALRYPILWEKHDGAQCDWSWTDACMERLQKLRIEPLIGLVHHGSGPPHTSLLDPDFSEGLAAHAHRVAQRYPWTRYYNPVNEPLTTARFSCLYGHWYPHRTEVHSFARAVINQCAAVKAAMSAIRSVNPNAQLVQTEDVGKTYSTRELEYQAAFENERRWFSFDLLSGRFAPGHALWDYIVGCGIDEKELQEFRVQPCRPDIFGINYYVVGERFLDQRLERYPQRTHGGNGRHTYADLAAVRVSEAGISGARGILAEAWERYRAPLAITEAHLACTREEQMRWLMDIWHAGRSLRADGADVRAITLWALLGAYDWHCLLTRREDHYEPGAFDLRAPCPRRTGIAATAQSLVRDGDCSHPVLDGQGWWRRPIRFSHPVAQVSGQREIERAAAASFSRPRRGRPRPLLITGATGTLGQAFRRLCDLRGLAYRLVSRAEMDIADGASVRRMLHAVRPWAVVNTAGYVRVDQAELEPQTCFRENTHAAGVLAAACRERDLPLLTYSSDLVFDGSKAQAIETDPVHPLGVYGMSKAQAERLVLQELARSLIVRSCCFFGPWDEYNIVTTTLQKIRAGETVPAICDAALSPTYLPDLVNASLDLLIDGECGMWHLANSGETTWAAFLRRSAEMGGADPDLIVPMPLESFGFRAQRPRASVLASGRGQLLPHWEAALGRYFEDRATHERQQQRALPKGRRAEPATPRVRRASGC